MKILVINSGSSSIKYQLFDMHGEIVLAKGSIERIGLEDAILKYQAVETKKQISRVQAHNHGEAIQIVLDSLIDPDFGVLTCLKEINAIGHRTVHGGTEFSKSVLIDDKIIKSLKRLYELAPLHNPQAVKGMEACKEILPTVPQIAVFDTAFHQTMPPHAYLYSLPYGLYKKYGIRRYGFHGTSHKYVAQRVAKLMGRCLSTLKIITCHLGNGASITAIDGGKSVDTSMGFTPLEGLTMGTRCGDIDPSIVNFLMEKENLDGAGLNELMNKKSGILGISGVSSDFRDVEEKALEGHVRARLALDVFVYQVKKHIGAYVAALDDLDALVFTAGLGENSPEMRQEVCGGLGYLGISIDHDQNLVRGKEAQISLKGSSVKVYVIPTNEELMIARDTWEIVDDLNLILEFPQKVKNNKISQPM